MTSADGSEACELVRKHNFSVVLSDIRMPGMNGLELLNFIKESDPEQTVIMFSGFGDVDSAVEAMKRGAFDYLSKPLILDELKITIRMALQQSKLRHENRSLRKELQDTLSALNNPPPVIPLLNNLPTEAIKEFLELGKMRTFDPQEAILRAGSVDSNLYIIFEGEISVWQDGAELLRLGKFECYGEMNLFRPNVMTQALTSEASSNLMIVKREALLDFFNRREEKYFKHYILNTLNSVHLKLRKASSRINHLESKLKE
jgi:DNA-binding NarL/FixJ family response regulator